MNNHNNIELTISTHSPYIINHLNLLIKAYDKDAPVNGAKVDYDKLSVFKIVEGELEDLMVKNERLVNTNPQSDTINSIYDEYDKLG